MDHVRWATVLLVLVYHVCYLFSGVGVMGGIPQAESIAAFDAMTYVVYPWLMVLLFVVAGIEKMRVPLLIAAVIGAVAYTVYSFGSDYTAPECLQSLATNLYLWVVVLAILGWARKCANGQTAFTRYMTRSSFGIYILHYPVLTLACYWLQYSCDIAAIWKYVIALGIEIVGTFALYEVISRMPVVRYGVLGQRKGAMQKKTPQKANA